MPSTTPFKSPQVRHFHPDDLEACIDIILSNVPRDFLPYEVEDFKLFLNKIEAFNPHCPYWVIEQNTAILGCGGIGPSIQDASRLVLIWGMIRRDVQKTGLGALLLQHRLDYAASHWPNVTVALDTSQHAQGFFARFGFMEINNEKDGFGPGLDKVTMSKPGRL